MVKIRRRGRGEEGMKGEERGKMGGSDHAVTSDVKECLLLEA